MVIQRQSNPNVVQTTWDVVQVLVNQKAGAEIEKVFKMLQQKLESHSGEELRNQLSYMIQDDLIILQETNGKDHYVLPDGCKRSGHDWYCFKCHKAGDVVACKSCPLVYHNSCIDGESEPFQCTMCQDALADSMISTELNHLLRFAYKVVKDKVRALQKHCKKPCVSERAKEYLCYKNITLTDVEGKLDSNGYKTVHEFQMDIYICLHNITILYGHNSVQATIALDLVEECIHEVEEMKLCTDCFKYSNEKACKAWFCLPCTKPHELVYVKVKRCPFWPGKVLRFSNGKYDVRFFGGRHERSLVDSENVKSVTEANKIPFKKSIAFNKAQAELKKHMELIEEAKKGVDVVTMLCGENMDQSFSEQGSITSSTTIEDSSEVIVTEQIQSNKRKSAPKRRSYTPLGNKKKAKVEDKPSKQTVSVVQTEGNGSWHMEIAGNSSVSIDAGEEENCSTDDEQLLPELKLPEKANPTKQPILEKAETSSPEGKRPVETRKMEFKQVVDELKRLRKENRVLRDMLKKMAVDLEVSKRQHWCYVCGSSAKYYCCWKGSYCSRDCQATHWKQNHKRKCQRVPKQERHHPKAKDHSKLKKDSHK